MNCSNPLWAVRIARVAPAAVALIGLPAMGAEGDQDLASKATDPTASLMAFNVISEYSNFHGPAVPGESGNQWTQSFRPAIPFKAFGETNILRLTVPFQTGGRGREGLGDVSVFDIVTINESWGRSAFGLVATFFQADDAPDKTAIGPAVGAVMPLSKQLNIGLFNQNLFASHTAVSQLQPIVAYQLGHGWSLSAGDAQFVYDWKHTRWLSVPLGIQLGQVTKMGDQPVRWSINPQYNLKNDAGLSKWSLSFTFSLLVPGS